MAPQHVIAALKNGTWRQRAGHHRRLHGGVRAVDHGFGVAATTGQLAGGVLAGYAFARFSFPGRRILFLVPFSALIVPVSELLGDLGRLNTYQLGSALQSVP
jgi:hypothetical protein